jgi:hypothetical protein
MQSDSWCGDGTAEAGRPDCRAVPAFQYVADDGGLLLVIVTAAEFRHRIRYTKELYTLTSRALRDQ